MRVVLMDSQTEPFVTGEEAYVKGHPITGAVPHLGKHYV